MNMLVYKVIARPGVDDPPLRLLAFADFLREQPEFDESWKVYEWGFYLKIVAPAEFLQEMYGWAAANGCSVYEFLEYRKAGFYLKFKYPDLPVLVVGPMFNAPSQKDLYDVYRTYPTLKQVNIVYSVDATEFPNLVYATNINELAIAVVQWQSSMVVV